MLRKSVEIACEARNTYYDKCGTSSSSEIMDDKILKKRPILVAASVGSYGAYLADGSEYRLAPFQILIYVDDMSLGWNQFQKLLSLTLFRFDFFAFCGFVDSFIRDLLTVSVTISVEPMVIRSRWKH